MKFRRKGLPRASGPPRFRCPGAATDGPPFVSRPPPESAVKPFGRTWPGGAEPLVVGLLCALFALSLGAHYGVSDQTLYLLSGIHLDDPSFLSRDWYVAEAVHHHAAFTLLVAALRRIGPLPWTTAALCLLLKAGVAWSACATLRALYGRPLTPFLVALPLLYLAVGSPKLLSHPFLVPWLIPSVLSTAFALAGVATLAGAGPDRLARCALSGALFGLSGLFHGTFLVMVPLFLAGVAAALRGRFTARELVAFGVPFLAAVLPAGWAVASRFELGGAGMDRLDALLRLRVPHHHLPRTWGWAGFSLFAKHAALGGIGLGLVRPKAPGAPVVLAAAASLAGLFLLVFLCTVVMFVPRVATLQPYHFLTLLSFFSLLFFAGAAAREAEAGGEPLSAPRVRRLALLGAGLCVAFWANPIVGAALAAMLGVPLAWPLVRDRARLARRTLAVGATLFLGGLAGFCLPLSTAFFDPGEPAPGIVRWVRERTPPRILATLVPPEAECDLYRWAKAETPRDAVFVVPLDLERFRLRAERAVVVDWKGFPYRARDAEEWYRRIVRVSGVPDPAAKEEVLDGYLRLDAERARALAREFGARYAVVRRDRHAGDLAGLRPVHANDLYAVYAIPADGR
jgi:hypothetical protein